MARDNLKNLVPLLILMAVASVFFLSGPSSDAQTKASGGDLVPQEIADYRTWTRVNENLIRSNNFTIDGQDS